ncbi:MAG TPA: transglycosylase SLT domain-containing protein [Bryobacteraceae bacterium]|jgi:soluble lytic murein transglycosylase-like protein|nr:transglycosylase SLT domain-containing protein [Bryobacteraceae bacterium]
MFFKTVSIVLFVALGLSASETVCLKSGFCLHADTHTQTGQTFRFQIGAGQIELQSSDIASLQEAPSPPAEAPRPPQRQQTAPDSKGLLAQAATEQGLDPDFVRSVASVESAFRQEALSKKGALGLMQLTPPTARFLGVNPYLATENALGGAKYLRSLLLKYHSNSALALAAYNAGPGAVQRFGGVPPYAETLNYIRSVTREYDRLHRATRSAASKVSLAGADHTVATAK